MDAAPNPVLDCVTIEHSRFRRAQRDIFVRRVVVECMSHECRLIDRGQRPGGKVKLDACCQYGVDVDLGERDGILAHAGEISALLDEDARAEPWFVGPELGDADFASGSYVRTNRVGDGCLFLAHDGRGCAIHRASIEGGWSFAGIKPHVCRLFPLTYTGDLICLSDDYADYSCSLDAGAPTVYRASRGDLGEFFGDDLIAALDRAEGAVLRARAGSEPVRLPISH